MTRHPDGDPFALHMAAAAVMALGEPTVKHGNDWRWGSKGSLSVRVDRGTFYDHERGLGGGVLDFLCHYEGCRDRREAVERLRRSGFPVPGHSPGDKVIELDAGQGRPEQVDTAGSRCRQARDLNRWREAVYPGGTLVENYLLKRGLGLTDDVAGSVLRFHPACPWKNERGVIIQVPIMIAPMRCIGTDRIKAVHRTRLTADAEKVKPPRMLGDAGGTAVKIDPDEIVTTGLVISEGIETALAARQLGLRPVWALGSAGGMT
jgi:hypothetical protein